MTPISLVVQLKEIRHTKDGGTRVILECGSESLDGIQELERLNSKGDTSLAIAIVKYDSEE